MRRSVPISRKTPHTWILTNHALIPPHCSYFNFIRMHPVSSKELTYFLFTLEPHVISHRTPNITLCPNHTTTGDRLLPPCDHKKLSVANTPQVFTKWSKTVARWSQSGLQWSLTSLRRFWSQGSCSCCTKSLLLTKMVVQKTMTVFKVALVARASQMTVDSLVEIGRKQS